MSTGLSVGSIKLMIQELEGIPPDRQRLIFAAKVLEDGHFLAEYNVALDSALTLIVE
jgi:ubiquitin C